MVLNGFQTYGIQVLRSWGCTVLRSCGYTCRVLGSQGLDVLWSHCQMFGMDLGFGGFMVVGRCVSRYRDLGF